MSGSIIIGIHGLANKPPLEEKQKWWKAAILEGLQKNCNKSDEELPFDFVYWADMRYKVPTAFNENPEYYYPKKEPGAFPAYHDHKWEVIFAKSEGLIGKEADWLKLHVGTTPIEDLALERELSDLAAYYEDEIFREDVRQRLISKIKEHSDKRIMLVAHSMGTIIAYDCLRILGKTGPKINIDHFVTIGSPLGLPSVKYKIHQENDLVRTPSIVGRWTNFADRRDIVAIDPKLADDYDQNDQGVKVVDVPVINAYVSPSDRIPPNKSNHHKSYGYLRTPEFSSIVRGFY